MNEFGTRLRAARLAAGMTQLQLARGIMSASQLSLLEQGRRRPSAQSLHALSARLAMPLAVLSPGLVAMGRPRPECRLEQAERALAQHNYATAERLASQVISSGTNAERRLRAYCLRGEARERLRGAQAALADYGLALDIAKRRNDTKLFVSVAVTCARLRLQLHPDDAA